jgi:hypothetical protein
MNGEASNLRGLIRVHEKKTHRWDKRLGDVTASHPSTRRRNEATSENGLQLAQICWRTSLPCDQHEIDGGSDRIIPWSKK